MNWLFAGELLCAGAVEGFACCRARPADWIGGRARRLALPWRDLLAAEPGQQTGSVGGPAGWPQRSAGESRRVADGDGFKFQNVRCVRECVGGVTEWEG